MQEAGKVVHLASSGRVIIQLARALDEGQVLCDTRHNRIARVSELIGPVARPFASAVPLTNNIKKYEGSRLFVTDDPPAKKQKFRRRRK